MGANLSTFKLDPAFEAALIADLEPRLERAGDQFAGALDENLAAGERSGIHWSGMPRRSSAPYEYPQEQTGQLRSGVFNRTTDDKLVREVGIADEQKKLNGLEFGHEPFLQPRAPVARTLESEDTQRAALEAMGGNS